MSHNVPKSSLTSAQLSKLASNERVSADALDAALAPLAGFALSNIYSGTGSPLNVVIAPIGSLYLRTDGGANTTLYVKESGAGASTGWVAK